MIFFGTSADVIIYKREKPIPQMRIGFFLSINQVGSVISARKEGRVEKNLKYLSKFFLFEFIDFIPEGVHSYIRFLQGGFFVEFHRYFFSFFPLH